MKVAAAVKYVPVNLFWAFLVISEETIAYFFEHRIFVGKGGY